jgi:hypothetical protein
MKTSKFFFAVASILFIAISFAGCKKNGVKRPVCRINKITVNNTAFHLSYSSDGKISSVIGDDGSSITYNYNGNTITLTNLATTGSFSSKNIITVNAGGLTTNARTEYNTTGSNWSNTAFEYNGEEVRRGIITYSGGGAPDTTTFTWASNNIVSTTSGSATNTWEYYTDKLRQDGDIIWFLKILFGEDVYRIKNLAKSLGTNESFSYLFDSEGKITAMLYKIGTTTTKYDYEYECH